MVAGQGAPRRVYLDNAATTRVSDVAFSAMEPFLRGEFGNPSALYAEARRARAAVDDARECIAGLIGAHSDEIRFTSCGTESDNWAIKGCMCAGAASLGRRGRFVTTAFEHPAVLNSAKALKREGFDVACATVDARGFVDEESFGECLDGSTHLASAMLANNEVGTIQPIARLAEIAHHAGARFHCDAVQAFGHIPVNVDELGVDYLSASGHKFHAPKGVGFLYVRRGAPIEPFIDGGHQEAGLRGGTENVAGIVGMAAAAKYACDHMEQDAVRIAGLRDDLRQRILAAIPGSCVNGEGPRVPGTLNVAVPNVDSAALVELLDECGVCAAGGSACSSRDGNLSHVLVAMGLDMSRIQGAVRFSLSDETTADDVEYAASALASCVDQLRSFGLIDLSSF